MDDKEPGSRLFGLFELFGDVFDDIFLNFIEFVIISGIDEGEDGLAEEGWRKRHDLTEETYEFLNFFVNDFLVSRLAPED